MNEPCQTAAFAAKFTELPGGEEPYGDPAHPMCGIPSAKDPSVVRSGDRYLMYYSVPDVVPVEAREGAVPGADTLNWGAAIAESRDLVHWSRVCDLMVEGSPFPGGWVAPAVREIGGMFHLFAQGPVPGRVMRDPLMNQGIWHATSADGIRFSLASDGPVFYPKNAWSNGRAIDADVWRAGDRLILAYASRDATETFQMIGLAAAPFGSDYAADKWIDLTPDAPLIAPREPWEGGCTEASTVVEHDGAFWLFYAGAYNHERQMIGLARAIDGVHFERVSCLPAFPHGPEGSWNAWESGHPGVFKDTDGSIYLFFQGKAAQDGPYRLSCRKVEGLGS